MPRRADPDSTRAILRQVNEQQHQHGIQRMFRVTYVYRSDAGTSATITHMQTGTDKRHVYREFCRLRDGDGLLDFLVRGPQECSTEGGDVIMAFPARNVYRIFIEEVEK